jgi:hypothetical protein
MKTLKEKTGNSTLTENDVRAIRRNAGKSTTRQLAEAYGIGIETVRKIIRRDTWQWIPDEPGEDEMDRRARESEAKMVKMMELQAASMEMADRAVKDLSWTEQQLSPEAKARLSLFRDVAPVPEVERPSGTAKARVMPLSPLDGGDGGMDETGGSGVALLERTLADGKARGVDNASALSQHNAMELLKELT